MDNKHIDDDDNDDDDDWREFIKCGAGCIGFPNCGCDLRSLEAGDREGATKSTTSASRGVLLLTFGGLDCPKKPSKTPCVEVEGTAVEPERLSWFISQAMTLCSTDKKVR